MEIISRPFFFPSFPLRSWDCRGSFSSQFELLLPLSAVRGSWLTNREKTRARRTYILSPFQHCCRARSLGVGIMSCRLARGENCVNCMFKNSLTVDYYLHHTAPPSKLIWIKERRKRVQLWLSHSPSHPSTWAGNWLEQGSGTRRQFPSRMVEKRRRITTRDSQWKNNMAEEKEHRKTMSDWIEYEILIRARECSPQIQPNSKQTWDFGYAEKAAKNVCLTSNSRFMDFHCLLVASI